MNILPENMINNKNEYLQMEFAERNINIDFLRGFVMLLLPLFHSSTGIVHTMIGVYQMPLLMGISGYLVGQTSTININWIKKRFLRLMIPFFFWSIVYWTPIFYKQNSFDLDAVTSTVYWFFLVLFILSILIYGIIKFEKCLKQFYLNKYCIVFIMLFIDLLVKIIALIINVHVISLCAWHITFYFGGYLLRRKELSCIRIKAIANDTVVIIGCIITMIFLECFSSISIMLNLRIKILFDYGITICVIFIIVVITKHLSIRFKRLFMPLSRFSTYIYIVHFFLLRQWCNEHWLNVIFCSLGGVIIPLGVAYLVNKNNLKWIKKVFGE